MKNFILGFGNFIGRCLKTRRPGCCLLRFGRGLSIGPKRLSFEPRVGSFRALEGEDSPSLQTRPRPRSGSESPRWKRREALARRALRRSEPPPRPAFGRFLVFRREDLEGLCSTRFPFLGRLQRGEVLQNRFSFFTLPTENFSSLKKNSLPPE